MQPVQPGTTRPVMPAPVKDPSFSGLWRKRGRKKPDDGWRLHRYDSEPMKPFMLVEAEYKDGTKKVLSPQTRTELSALEADEAIAVLNKYWVGLNMPPTPRSSRISKLDLETNYLPRQSIDLGGEEYHLFFDYPNVQAILATPYEENRVTVDLKKPAANVEVDGVSYRLFNNLANGNLIVSTMEEHAYLPSIDVKEAMLHPKGFMLNGVRIMPFRRASALVDEKSGAFHLISGRGRVTIDGKPYQYIPPAAEGDSSGPPVLVRADVTGEAALVPVTQGEHAGKYKVSVNGRRFYLALSKNKKDKKDRPVSLTDADTDETLRFDRYGKIELDGLLYYVKNDPETGKRILKTREVPKYPIVEDPETEKQWVNLENGQRLLWYNGPLAVNGDTGEPLPLSLESSFSIGGAAFRLESDLFGKYGLTTANEGYRVNVDEDGVFSVADKKFRLDVEGKAIEACMGQDEADKAGDGQGRRYGLNPRYVVNVNGQTYRIGTNKSGMRLSDPDTGEELIILPNKDRFTKVGNRKMIQHDEPITGETVLIDPARREVHAGYYLSKPNLAMQIRGEEERRTLDELTREMRTTGALSGKNRGWYLVQTRHAPDSKKQELTSRLQNAMTKYLDSLAAELANDADGSASPAGIEARLTALKETDLFDQLADDEMLVQLNALEADCLNREIESIREAILVAGGITPGIRARIDGLQSGETVTGDVKQRLSTYFERANKEAIKGGTAALLADIRKAGQLTPEIAERLAALKTDLNEETAARLDTMAATMVEQAEPRKRRRFWA